MNTAQAQQGSSLGYSLVGKSCILKNTNKDWRLDNYEGKIKAYNPTAQTYKVTLTQKSSVPIAVGISTWVKRHQFDLIERSSVPEPGPLGLSEAENLVDELLQADRVKNDVERIRLRQEIVNRMTTGQPFWATPAGLRRAG